MSRAAEVNQLESMNVFTRVPRHVATGRGIQPMATKWLDQEKAPKGQAPDIRSRCVVKGIAYSKRNDIFAGTPSLEALKLLASKLASSNKGHRAAKRLQVLGVKRVFLYAELEREVYIELPEEAKRPGEGDVVGRLDRAMYGTREALQAWQRHITDLLRDLGCVAGKSQPCVFHHPMRDLQLVVHVDDIACIGLPRELDWFQTELGKHVECKERTLGPGPGEHSEVAYLGRMLRWQDDGISYERDSRHGASALKAAGMEMAKEVNTLAPRTRWRRRTRRSLTWRSLLHTGERQPSSITSRRTAPT